MIVQPKIRGFICTTAHPVGCAASVKQQIDYVQSRPAIKNGPRKVLVVGASTGYGLASRITAGFGSRAATFGVFYEKEAENKRTATAGWYNSQAFERFAKAQGLYARSINGDAFADDIKQQTVETIKKDLGEIDLLIYSLASPRRIHPKTGVVSKSVLKPKDVPYTNKSIDFEKEEIISVTLPPASEEEINQTVAVMGGEDWAMWMQALERAGLLAKKFFTVAYSYIGPAVTYPVYRNGTIGAAKEHLEATAKELDQRLRAQNGRALISVNKALVTQSSSAIPFIPLYFIILMKVMRQKGLHEDCIQQIYRLFADCLYCTGEIPVDEAGRVRIDDLEMRADVQREVEQIWKIVSNENVKQVADVAGYHQDFLRLFGFGLPGVNYDADVEI